MDSELRRRFLQLLNADLARVDLGFLPFGDVYWPALQRWWVSNTPCIRIK